MTRRRNTTILTNYNPTFEGFIRRELLWGFWLWQEALVQAQDDERSDPVPTLLRRQRYLHTRDNDTKPQINEKEHELRKSDWIGIFMATVVVGCMVLFLARQAYRGCPLYRHARQRYRRKQIHYEIHVLGKSTVIKATGRTLEVAEGPSNDDDTHTTATMNPTEAVKEIHDPPPLDDIESVALELTTEI